MSRFLKDLFLLSIQSRYNLKRNYLTPCMQLSSPKIGQLIFDLIYALCMHTFFMIMIVL